MPKLLQLSRWIADGLELTRLEKLRHLQVQGFHTLKGSCFLEKSHDFAFREAESAKFSGRLISLACGMVSSVAGSLQGHF